MSRLRLIAEEFKPFGIHIYLLFAVYSVTVAPYITRFTNFGEKNYIIGILGLIMYVAEYFAFKFKLKMIRVNMELKRQEYFNRTGNIIHPPRVGVAIWWATFMRMPFRLGFLIISYMAFGFKEFSPGIGIVLFGLFTLEVLLFGRVTVIGESGLFREMPVDKQELKEQKLHDEEWAKKSLELADCKVHDRKEFYADIILHLYAFMIYTAFWDYINTIGVQTVAKHFKTGEPAWGAIINLSTLIFGMTLIGMIPMRLAYWIERSVTSFTRKEKIRLRFYFFMAVLFTCAPSVAELIRLYFRQTP